MTDSSGALRVKSATSKYTKGQQYLQAALDTRDGPRAEETLEATAPASETPTDMAEEEASALELPLEETRVEVDILAGNLADQRRRGG